MNLREEFKKKKGIIGGINWLNYVNWGRYEKDYVEWLEVKVKKMNYMQSSLQLPTSTQLLSDCNKRFKDLQGKGNLDYRSYQNGYLDSFSKYVVSKTK